MAKTNPAAEAPQDGVDFEDGDNFSFNMKETAEDTGLAPLPKGTYLCTLDQVEYKLSKSSGAPMWSFIWAVAEGEFAEKNRKVYGDFLSFKPGQEGKVKKFLLRVAPNLAELEDFRPKKIADEGLLVGLQAKLRLEIEPGTPEYPNPKNRVKEHFAPTGGSAGSTGGAFQM